MNLVRLRREWAPDVTREILAGTVVALALIPESLAFSVIAGVDPKVALYASFCIAVVTAIAGGRPAMISAATGATALLMTSLVKDHGLGHLLAATILTGLIQIVAGAFRLGDLMRFVSRSVVTGFVNALAILIFLAQMPELIGRGPVVYAMTTVGDMGALPSELPGFALPQVPLTLETLRIILPYSLTIAMVGLLESLMTAAIIDERTGTTSNKNRECTGQGLANVTAGLFGGMAGCAMIGQSMINVSSGGRGRLSTLWSGAFLLFLIVVLGRYVAQIPMAALVAVMIVVSVDTFQWRSIRTLLTHPTTSSVVMLGTVAVVLVTHDLAKGVLFGVGLSGLFFAHKVTRFFAVASTREGGTRTYRVTGQIFFATAEAFHAGFDFREEDLSGVVIDVTQAHFWDLTAVNALDRVVLKFRHHGVPVEISGLNAASATLVDKLGTHDKPGAALASGH
jgi:SulP family sulfate permease